MLLYLKAILFGVVEGITEWLPISSTGHMILLDQFVKLDVFTNATANTAYYEMFQVVIQLGAILAVVVIFWDKIWPFKKNPNPLVTGWEAHMDRDICSLWVKIIAACLPAAVIGLAFDDLFTALFYNYWCVAIALIVFGIAFIIIENRNATLNPRVHSLKAINGKTAMIIGLFQVIAAIFPGTSRSGATILGGLAIGVSRTVAAEFTFFLAIPVMFGASLLKIAKYIIKGAAINTTGVLVLLVGCVTAFIVSMIFIKFLMNYIKKHDFKVFGYYRIALGALVILYALFH